MDQVTARINFIEVALGSFVGNPNEIDRQNALLSELDSFDANLKKQLKGYVGMTKDKLEQQLHELQKEKNLLQEEKNKQLGLSAGNHLFWLVVCSIICFLCFREDDQCSIQL
jgi:hypothetical protein